MADNVSNDLLRVWTIEGGAGPGNVPVYQGCFKPGDFTRNYGDITRVECPDPNEYGRFIEVGLIRGEAERVTLPLMGRYPMSVSDLLRLADKGCRVDVHVVIGKCRDPRSFNRGWEKKMIFPNGIITTYGVENFGALQSSERAQVNETADLSARELYEVGRISFQELAGSTIAREIITVDVCDSINCGGECGPASDGCQVVLATQVGASATPGTQPSVVISSDGGATFATRTITTLFSNEAPSDAECVGDNFVIVAQIPNSLHYASVADLQAGTQSWVEVNTGFVTGGGPNAIWAAGPSDVWIVGQGGYIYYTSDPTTGVTVQNAGVATTQALADVHAFDALSVVAVGAANAVVFTKNGGDTWAAVTGPVVGVALTAVWMLSPEIWLVGTAGGALWYTVNSGVTWAQIGLPATYTQIDSIMFVNDTVGYLAARTSAPAGKVLRTTDGGRSWYVIPEAAGQSIPANDYINDIAVCRGLPNTLYAGGLGDNATDGFLVKGA